MVGLSIPPGQAADNDLQRRVSNHLASRYLPALRRLQVCVQNGAVTLRGSTSSFYERQVAIHCCQRVAGVRQLIDEINVAPTQ